MQTKITKLPHSAVEIESELDAQVFESYYSKALKRIAENIGIDGFRKGKAPEGVVAQKVGEMRILEEMAELALGEHYPKILEAEKIDAIGRPEISIIKLGRNNPLLFKINTAVLPEIKLADYKKISKDTLSGVKEQDKNADITDEELENTITDIRKSRAPKINMRDVVDGEEVKDLPEAPLPEFNDEFVQALGPFTDVEDFKNKLKENLKLEKINNQKEKLRLQIIEKIVDESTIDVPEILVNLELDKILYKIESDITQMGLKFEDYLKHINKSKEDLSKDFRPDAEKKAKLALILNEISKVENIVASDEDIAKEVAHILEHYKEADPERARMHAENVLTNEKIFNFWKLSKTY